MRWSLEPLHVMVVELSTLTFWLKNCGFEKNSCKSLSNKQMIVFVEIVKCCARFSLDIILILIRIKETIFTFLHGSIIDLYNGLLKLYIIDPQFKLDSIRFFTSNSIEVVHLNKMDWLLIKPHFNLPRRRMDGLCHEYRLLPTKKL